MLYVRPRSIFSQTYDISLKKNGSPLTWVSMRWLREGGSFSLDGQSYALGRASWMSGDFFLERDGQRVAHADKTSALLRRFTVTISKTEYTLRAHSAFSRRFDLF